MSEQQDSAPDLRAHMNRTATTAVYPFSGSGNVQGLMYIGLGIAGEAGEIANQVKKIARDDGGFVTPERRGKIEDELGDVGWYWLRFCYELGFDPYEVLARNEQKLRQRALEGTLNGDKRNGSLARQSAVEWEAQMAEANGKEDVFAVPAEGLRALIYNGVITEHEDNIHGRVTDYIVRCRSLRCTEWSEKDDIDHGYTDLHQRALSHIMAEHTPWGRAGRD